MTNREFYELPYENRVALYHWAKAYVQSYYRYEDDNDPNELALAEDIINICEYGF